MASSLLGHGIYGSREVARLLRRHPEQIARWTTNRRNMRALLEPSQGDLFSFRDLISLLVVAELWDRGVSADDIRRGTEWLSEVLKTERPLAHKEFATVGSAWFARLEGDRGGWYNAGRGGQGAFEVVIKHWLMPIEYDAESMAVLWRPHERVWINPMVQAGTPCVEATRIPTDVLAALAEDEEDLDDLADDYGIEVADIEAAVEYERTLRQAA